MSDTQQQSRGFLMVQECLQKMQLMWERYIISQISHLQRVQCEQMFQFGLSCLHSELSREPSVQKWPLKKSAESDIPAKKQSQDAAIKISRIFCRFAVTIVAGLSPQFLHLIKLEGVKAITGCLFYRRGKGYDNTLTKSILNGLTLQNYLKLGWEIDVELLKAYYVSYPFWSNFMEVVNSRDCRRWNATISSLVDFLTVQEYVSVKLKLCRLEVMLQRLLKENIKLHHFAFISGRLNANANVNTNETPMNITNGCEQENKIRSSENMNSSNLIPNKNFFANMPPIQFGDRLNDEKSFLPPNYPFSHNIPPSSFLDGVPPSLPEMPQFISPSESVGSSLTESSDQSQSFIFVNSPQVSPFLQSNPPSANQNMFGMHGSNFQHSDLLEAFPPKYSDISMEDTIL